MNGNPDPEPIFHFNSDPDSSSSEHLKLLNFDFYSDPDPDLAFHSNADPLGSGTLSKFVLGPLRSSPPKNVDRMKSSFILETWYISRLVL